METTASFFTCKTLHRSRSPAAIFYAKSRSLPVLVSCSLSQQQPSYDGSSAIESDWRSFRARLVAGQQPSSSLFMPPIPDKWAHPLHEPEKGCILIATEKLDGVHIFERTVILVLTISPLGPAGVILNRPSLMSIKETRSPTSSFPIFADRPLSFGGPLEDSVFLMKAAPTTIGEEVMEGVWFGTKESVRCGAKVVKRGAARVEDFRFFDGYCGWEREQLREEIRAGYWTVAACSAEVVGESGAGLWEEVVGLVGGKKVF